MIIARRATTPMYRLKIGNREVVGPSISGQEEYYDRVDCPCPPIRYKPPSPEFDALREKEKGDWRSLSIEDKKKLYRLNYCQTFKEIEAPHPEKKRIFGNVMFLLSIPLLLFVVMKKTVFPPLPDTMSDQGKKQVVRWYIDARADPLDGGISSKWDYEKNEWKEKPYFFMKK